MPVVCRIPFVLPRRSWREWRMRALCSIAIVAACGLSAATAAPDAAPAGLVAAAPDVGSGSPPVMPENDASQAEDLPGLIEAPRSATAPPGEAVDIRREAPNRLAAPATPDIRTAPVVVELFTSQGCSNCPPADRMLAALAARTDVLALAWHVDYWDYLGWADAFARPEHSHRQEGYALAAGERGVYTPQIIVDGQDTLITARPADLMAMIDEHRARPAAIMVMARSDGARHQIQLTPRAAIPGGVTVLMVRYAPSRTVAVRAGENRGQTIDYANVVLDSEILARWDARAPLRLTIAPGEVNDPDFPADTRHAILAQQALPGEPPLPGPILAAITLE